MGADVGTGAAPPGDKPDDEGGGGTPPPEPVLLDSNLNLDRAGRAVDKGEPEIPTPGLGEALVNLACRCRPGCTAAIPDGGGMTNLSAIDSVCEDNKPPASEDDDRGCFVNVGTKPSSNEINLDERSDSRSSSWNVGDSR